MIRYAIEYLRSLVKSESGQDLTEYALITGGVAIAAVIAVALLGTAFSTWFTDMATWVGSLTP